MDDRTSWDLVEAMGARGWNQPSRVPAAMGYLEARELLAWQRILVERARALRTHRHMSAAEVFHGGLGDDSGADFRVAVVLTGQRAYESFLNDPDSFAAHYTEFAFMVAEEEIGHVDALFHAQAGQHMYKVSPDDTVYVGSWPPLEGIYVSDPTELQRRYPRTWRVMESSRSGSAN